MDSRSSEFKTLFEGNMINEYNIRKNQRNIYQLHNTFYGNLSISIK